MVFSMTLECPHCGGHLKKKDLLSSPKKINTKLSILREGHCPHCDEEVKLIRENSLMIFSVEVVCVALWLLYAIFFDQSVSFIFLLVAFIVLPYFEKCKLVKVRSDEK